MNFFEKPVGEVMLSVGLFILKTLIFLALLCLGTYFWEVKSSEITFWKWAIGFVCLQMGMRIDLIEFKN